MPLIRKRRTRDVEEEPESSEEEEAQPRGPQRRRTTDNVPTPTQHNDDQDDAGYGSDDDHNSAAAGSVTQLARKLCRHALACEYSRQPIRRTDIGAKVLGERGRMFKQVFAEAQGMLREVFGMEMVELPARERVTLQQKRAAQTQGKKETSSNAFVLVSTLPPKYRAPDIIPPPAIPTKEQEASYTAIYTFVCTLIYLHGGKLPDSKLDRHLRRLNADRTTPLGSTEDLMKRLQKDLYIVKHVEKSDDTTEYMVGPRGKVEVGEEGAGGLVRTVYGGALDDLESRLDRSLGISSRQAAAESRRKEEKANETNATQARRKSQRGRTQRQESSEEESEEEDEDD